MYIVTRFVLIGAHKKKRIVKSALQEPSWKSSNCLIDSPITKKIYLCVSLMFKLYKTETFFFLFDLRSWSGIFEHFCLTKITID